MESYAGRVSHYVMMAGSRHWARQLAMPLFMDDCIETGVHNDTAAVHCIC